MWRYTGTRGKNNKKLRQAAHAVQLVLRSHSLPPSPHTAHETCYSVAIMALQRRMEMPLIGPSTETLPSDSLRICHYCHQKESKSLKLKTCSSCYIRTFCSKECQRADWPSHKSVTVLSSLCMRKANTEQYHNRPVSGGVIECCAAATASGRRTAPKIDEGCHAKKHL